MITNYIFQHVIVFSDISKYIERDIQKSVLMLALDNTNVNTYENK